MPDILIRGMEMPAKGYKTIILHSNVRVYEPTSEELIVNKIADATELPPHGDLVDIQNGVTDAKFILFDDEPNDYQLGWNDGIDAVCHYAPVVVPAERSDTDA